MTDRLSSGEVQIFDKEERHSPLTAPESNKTSPETFSPESFLLRT
jgi:hypothetical protein